MGTFLAKDPTFIPVDCENVSPEEEALGVYTKYEYHDDNAPFPRCVVVFKPHSLKDEEKVPLVVLFPGTDEPATYTELKMQKDEEEKRVYSWQEKANAEGFLIAIAEGKKEKNPSLPKVRYCFDIGDSDLIYFDNIFKFLTTNFPIDQKRIYGCGFSVGGLFTSSLAIYRPFNFSALCNYMGGMAYLPNYIKDPDERAEFEKIMPKISDAKGKIPIFLITASGDDNILYCMNAKKNFEEAGWDLTFRNIPDESHHYIANQTPDIWEWMIKYQKE